eukprot:1158714-Pelagomonas_calceolata.AAC.6
MQVALPAGVTSVDAWKNSLVEVFRADEYATRVALEEEARRKEMKRLAKRQKAQKYSMRCLISKALGGAGGAQAGDAGLGQAPKRVGACVCMRSTSEVRGGALAGGKGFAKCRKDKEQGQGCHKQQPPFTAEGKLPPPLCAALSRSWNGAVGAEIC